MWCKAFDVLQQIYPSYGAVCMGRFRDALVGSAGGRMWTNTTARRSSARRAVGEGWAEARVPTLWNSGAQSWASSGTARV